jgi:hypothetical protein
MNMQRTIIIGDTHGCSKELEILFETLDLTDEDRVISVGDLLDKGPDSPGVVRLFKKVGAELALGNHEEKLLRFLGHEIRIRDFLRDNPKQTPKPNPMQQTGRLQDYLKTLSQDELDYLATAKVHIQLPEHGAMVIHGGIEPRTEKLPSEDFFALKGKEKSSMSKLIRTRFVSMETGKMLPIGENGPDDPFWADAYNGRFGHVFFGHDPNPEGDVRLFPHATGLDTGAVFGGRLTAAILIEGEETTFVSVPAFAKYAESLYEE